MSKSNLPLTLTGEKIEYNRLYDLTGTLGRNMTTTGEYEFTSLSSETTYSTVTGGEYNVFLQLQTVLAPYGIVDIDFNPLVDHLVVEASDTVKGHVELATPTETTTGTDSTRAVTPFGLKSTTNLLIPLTQKGVGNGVATLLSGGDLAQKYHVTGTYTGDGTATRDIVLGFTPSIAIVFKASGDPFVDGYSTAETYYGGVAITGFNHSALSIITNGIQVKYVSGSIMSNDSGQLMGYLAFR